MARRRLREERVDGDEAGLIRPDVFERRREIAARKTQHAAWKAEAVADRCHSLRVDDEDCDVCCQPMAV